MDTDFRDRRRATRPASDSTRSPDSTSASGSTLASRDSTRTSESDRAYKDLKSALENSSCASGDSSKSSKPRSKTKTAALKPASPPKSNPWFHRNTPAAQPSKPTTPHSMPTSDGVNATEEESAISPSRSRLEARAASTTQRSPSKPAHVPSFTASEQIAKIQRLVHTIHTKKHMASQKAKSVSDEGPSTPRETPQSPFKEDLQSFPAFPPLDGTSSAKPASKTCWTEPRKLFAKLETPATATKEIPVDKPLEFPVVHTPSSAQKRRSGTAREGDQRQQQEVKETQLVSTESRIAFPPLPGLSNPEAKTHSQKRRSAWDTALPKLRLDNPVAPAIGEDPLAVVEDSPVAIDEDNTPPSSPKSTPSPPILYTPKATPRRRSASLTAADKTATCSTSLPPPMARSFSLTMPGDGEAGTADDRREHNDDNVSAPDETAPSKPAEPSYEVRTDIQDRLFKESLWKHPIDADVHVFTDRMVYHVHRDIITPQCGWLRKNLPPPNLDGSPVEIKVPFTDGAVVHCLRFMYTHSVEICEYNPLQVLNMIHLPRCVLAYEGAVSLGIDKMVSHVVAIVEYTSTQLQRLLRTQVDQHDPNWNVAFSVHLHHALLVTYEETSRELMKPMRMALASVMDVSISYLILQPAFLELTRSEAWRRHGAAISWDMVEYRERARAPQA